MEYFFNFDKMGYLKGAKPQGCILCHVGKGSEEVERLVVYENGLLVVSLNLYPYNPGHLIIFPRRHVTDIRMLEEREKKAMDMAVDRCLDLLDKTYNPAGYNIGYNQGMAAGASIEHLHLHIIPRYRNEIGIAELLGGKKVLVQDPLESLALLKDAYAADAQDDEKGGGAG